MSFDHWMFQHPDGRRWIGYRAGTYLVDQAMEISGMTTIDLLQVSTEQVLGMAGLSDADPRGDEEP